MKVYMYSWAGRIENLPDWFKNNEYADVSLDQIKEVFDTGNNVMLYHFTSNSNVKEIHLYVDNKRFGQR